MAAPRTLSSRLRHRIHIQQATQVQNEYGELVPGWATVDTVYAEIAPVSGREFLEARAINDETTVRFVIRWSSTWNTRSGLGSDMRIVDPVTSYVYRIESINHVHHARRMIEIVATLTNEQAA